jgi:hypothetical protein
LYVSSKGDFMRKEARMEIDPKGGPENRFDRFPFY